MTEEALGLTPEERVERSRNYQAAEAARVNHLINPEERETENVRPTKERLLQGGLKEVREAGPDGNGVALHFRSSSSQHLDDMLAKGVIEDKEHRAAESLRSDWFSAGHHITLEARPSESRIDGRTGRCVEDLIDRRRRLDRIQREFNELTWGCLEHVVVGGMSLREWTRAAKERGWYSGRLHHHTEAKAYLTSALMDLIVIYKI